MLIDKAAIDVIDAAERGELLLTAGPGNFAMSPWSELGSSFDPGDDLGDPVAGRVCTPDPPRPSRHPVDPLKRSQTLDETL